ncbi:MAG: MnhB domain-containing protein, partial [Wenzhouxiangellaceae bacterium]
LVAVIGLTTIGLEHDPGRAGGQVLERLPETGLGNPVTGVLLVFRGLDTLLEMVVLLAALLGARIVTAGDRAPVRAASRDVLPLVGSLRAIVIPLTLLVAVHLLIQGADDAGGAFQAGAVLAAAGVLLLLSGRLVPSERATAMLRFALVLGIAAFMLMAWWPIMQGRGLLAPPGKGIILAVEAAMMLSIGLTLTLLFSGSAGVRAGPS